MYSYSSPILPESQNSTHLLLTLAAPPSNLTPEYFYQLLTQYGPVCKVKIISKSVLDYRVVVEMASLEAARVAKQALDQISSAFIKTSYYHEETKRNTSFNICSMETIEDTVSTAKNRASGSLIEFSDYENKQPSLQFVPTSSKLIASNKNIQLSKTICLSGIQGNIDANKLYSIFSNFGNIDKILLIRIKNFALVKYLKEDYATFAIQHCQNLKFFDSLITISYTADDGIDKLLTLDTLYQEQDYFVGNDETDRFNANNKMNLLPPSQVLHISNLKKISSNADTMWDIFSDFGVVDAVKVLNAQFKFMCLIKMENIKQALEVMACMHNEEIDGRNIQISFTKARI